MSGDEGLAVEVLLAGLRCREEIDTSYQLSKFGLYIDPDSFEVGRKRGRVKILVEGFIDIEEAREFAETVEDYPEVLRVKVRRR